MKIPATFKLKEIFGIFCVLLVVVSLFIGLASAVLFQMALFIFIPFLVIGLWNIFCNRKTIFPTLDIKTGSQFFLIFKVSAVFLILLISYFAFGQGLLLYQTASYDELGQPMLTQFANSTQLLWAVKLSVITWVMASSLAFAMGILNKNKISQFLIPINTSRYAVVVDILVAFSFILVLFLFIGMTSVEISRSVVALFGLQWPIFPELTAFVLALTLFAGYRLFHIKKRIVSLAEKSASIGSILLMQMLWVVIFLLLGQAILVFFPEQMIMPLVRPIINLLPALSYEKTWLFLTLTLAILSVPVLARFLARILAGLTIGRAAIFLTLPLLISLLLLYPLGLAWVPKAYFVPIGLENIVYRVGGTQVILISSLLVLFFCFIRSESLQMAWIDLMPVHLRQRSRRLRVVLAEQTFFLMVCTLIYLFFANIGYYFLGSIFLVFITVILLWVGLYLFYTLTYTLKKGR